MKLAKRILVAESPEFSRLTRQALEDHFIVMIATSLVEARTLLNKELDFVLCGVHFDEGRMFDLLRYAKADPDTKSIPFLCIKSSDGSLSPAIFQSIEIASKALGADGFVELYEWRAELGDDAAHEKFRQLINRLA